MQQAQNGYQARQNGLGNLKPASIDSIVNQISSDIENRILKQASGQGICRALSESKGLITRRYECRYYVADVPVIFEQKACTAIYYHGGGESDSDNERYYVGVRNLGEAKQIAIAIMHRMYANKMQVEKPQINKTGQRFFNPPMELYSLDEVIRLIQKSTTLKLDGFSTSLIYVVSKTQKR